MNEAANLTPPFTVILFKSVWWLTLLLLHTHTHTHNYTRTTTKLKHLTSLHQCCIIIFS